MQALDWATLCWQYVTFFLKSIESILESPWLFTGELSVGRQNTFGNVKFLTALLSMDHHSLIHSMNIYLLPAGTGNWCIEYLEVTGLIFICHSINIYIHSIVSQSIVDWFWSCVFLSLIPAYAQIRASKIPAHNLHKPAPLVIVYAWK